MSSVQIQSSNEKQKVQATARTGVVGLKRTPTTTNTFPLLALAILWCTQLQQNSPKTFVKLSWSRSSWPALESFAFSFDAFHHWWMQTPVSESFMDDQNPRPTATLSIAGHCGFSFFGVVEMPTGETQKEVERLRALAGLRF
jgi:hypothetical protein